MTSHNENELSRRAFLTMSWRRDDSASPTETSRSATADNLTLIGSIESLRELAVGDVVTSPRRADIHAVRTATGILALRSRCPNDGALVEWRGDEQSEDALASIGRFYCSRNASIFNRLGELVAGPADGPLPTLVIAERHGSLWVDEAKPEAPDSDERLQREFALA
ncbi:MAG: hypothetical protein F4X20_00415 [Dehalococcoidia bacterium]|nr:hypothetical protein [Dehalococcoidia bacterium]